MRVSDFQFELPEDLIAQSPPSIRGSSRMLALNRQTGAYRDDAFANLADHLSDGDLLILNDSRVIPARLFAIRAGLHTQPGSPNPAGRIEVLLTQQLSAQTWTALVRPSRKVQPGETLSFADPADLEKPALTAEVLTAGAFGERTLRFEAVPDFFAILDCIGHIPLPPYIRRDDSQEDRSRYQTVFADMPGSAAAPTAGLHFTPEMLHQLRVKGVQVETITLHVGLGTFQPVRVEQVADIRLHAERYTLSASTSRALNAAMAEGRRVIAAGTTTTRTLEHCARIFPGEFEAHTGETSIFISPGDEFHVVQGLLTNFHLPQSTLLMLVSAFAGRENVLAAYAHAVTQRYRFFSYGDCMLLL